MEDERVPVVSPFHDKQYRDGYVAAHTRGLLARQVRNFRGDFSQSDYATKIGKQKTVVGRLENPAYSGWSVRTMLEIASKEDVALLACFVDFPTFWDFVEGMSEDSLHPRAYSKVEIERFAEGRLSQSSRQKTSFGQRQLHEPSAALPDNKKGWNTIELKQGTEKSFAVNTVCGTPRSDIVVANRNLREMPVYPIAAQEGH